MKSQLFIGFKIPRQIIRTINMVRTTLEREQKYYNWVSGNNLHLTLLFLGNQEQNKINDLSQIINVVLKDFNDFSFSVNGTGTFSNNQILWLGIDKGREQLESINYQLRIQLEKIENYRDRNKYFPHITVARRKKDYIQNKIDVKNFMNSVYFPIEFHINFFTLFESKIVDNRVHYKRISEFNLT